MGDRIFNACDHARVRAISGGVQNAHGNQPGAGRYAHHTYAVILGADNACDMRSMAIGIIGRAVTRQQARAACGIHIEVGMRKIDPGIDDPGGFARSASWSADACNAPRGHLR